MAEAELEPVSANRRTELHDLFTLCNSGKTSLLLYRRNLRDNDMVELHNFLREKPLIHKINLKRNNITTLGAKVIRDILLDKNLTITELDLSMNSLRDDGIKYIGEAIALNRTLKNMFLTNTGIENSGAQALANALRDNTSLVGLSVDHNPFMRTSESTGRLRLADAVNIQGKLMVLTVSSSMIIRLDFVRLLIQTEIEGKERTDSVLQYSHDRSNRILEYILDQWRMAKKRGIPLMPIPKELVKEIAEIAKKGSSEDFPKREEETFAKVKAFMEASGFKGGQETMKRAKMLIVGSARAGKSSLTDSLIANRSALTGESKSRATLCVQIKPWRVEGMVCSMYDFGGQEEYYMTHSFFVSPRAVVMIVVNLSTYEETEEDYNSHVQYWIDAIQAHAPGAKYIIVGTHIDLVEDHREVYNKTDHILRMFRENEERVKAQYEQQILELEPEKDSFAIIRLSSMVSLPTIDRNDHVHFFEPQKLEVLENTIPSSGYANGAGIEGLKQHKKSKHPLMKGSNATIDDITSDFESQGADKMQSLQEKLNQRPILLFGKVFAVSCEAKAEGLAYLSKHITDMLRNPIDTGTSIEFPTSYVKLTEEIDQYIKEQATKSPVMTLGELKKLFVNKKKLFSNQERLEVALELLHDTGYILWYKNIPTLSASVFLSPQWVVDMIKSVIRHDMFTNDIDALDSVREIKNLKKTELSKLKLRFINEAILDVRLLYSMGIWKTARKNDRVQMLLLMNYLDLLSFMPKADSDVNTEVFIPVYLKPSFKEKNYEPHKPTIPEALMTLFPQDNRGFVENKATATFQGKHIQYRFLFANFYPEGVFLRLLVKIFAYAEVDFDNICESAAKLHTEGGNMIYIEEQRNFTGIHGDSLPGVLFITGIAYQAMEELWDTLALVTCEVEELLRSFPGLEVGVFTAHIDDELGKVVIPRDNCERLQLKKLADVMEQGIEIRTSGLYIQVEQARIMLSQLLPEVYLERHPEQAPIPKLIRKSFLGRSEVQLRNISHQIRSPQWSEKNRMKLLHVELRNIIDALLRQLCRTISSEERSKKSLGHLRLGWDEYFVYLNDKKLDDFKNIAAETRNLKPFDYVLFNDKPVKLQPSRLELILINAEKLLDLLRRNKRERVAAFRGIQSL